MTESLSSEHSPESPHNIESTKTGKGRVSPDLGEHKKVKNNNEMEGSTRSVTVPSPALRWVRVESRWIWGRGKKKHQQRNEGRGR
jgi:hypothetical protein